MRSSIFIMTAFLTGCATPPVIHQVENHRTVARPFDSAWTDIVGFFASHSLAIKNIAKDSGLIYAENSGFDNSLADCGSNPIAQIVGRTATLNVFVRKRPDEQIDITVNTTFRETRRVMQTFVTVQCTSTGALEDAIIETAAHPGS